MTFSNSLGLPLKGAFITLSFLNTFWQFYNISQDIYFVPFKYVFCNKNLAFMRDIQKCVECHTVHVQ